MKNFNRILHFDEKKKLITVESGITFVEFLNFTLGFGLWINQIPGYPFITIGGAVASNAHGKSGGEHGTIRNVIKEIVIFHKEHGWLNLSNDKNKNIFDLTIGGYGLTGTIVSVTLQLINFEGNDFETSINKIHSITETVNFIKKNKVKNNFVYSWNRVDSNSSNFGDGLIFCNKINSQNREKNLNKKIEDSICLNSQNYVKGQPSPRGTSSLFTLLEWIENLDKWIDLKDSQLVFRFAYQVIAKRGSQGGGFRYIYEEFLKFAESESTKINKLKLSNQMHDIAKLWEKSALLMKKISDKKNRKDLVNLKKTLSNLYSLEYEYHSKVLDVLGSKKKGA